MKSFDNTIDVGWMTFPPDLTLETLINIDLLPSGFREELKRFKRPEDRIAKLLSRLLLLRLLGHPTLRLGVLEQIELDQYKRPFLPGGPDFNLSHTEGMVGIAVSKVGRIGIDLERVREVPIEELREAFTDGEWEKLQTETDPYRQLYTIWTRKEAVIKADGGALLRWNPATFPAGEGPHTHLGQRKYYLTQLELMTGYCGWVASEHHDVKLNIRRFHVEDILPDL